MPNQTSSPLNSIKPEIEDFIQALNASSQRSRTMLIAIIFASILTFIALINSLKSEWNWFQSRLAVRRTALEHFMFLDGERANSAIAPLQDSTKQARPAIQEQETHASIEDFANSLENRMPDSTRIRLDEIKAILHKSCNDGGQFTTWLFGSVKPEMPYWIRIKPFPSDFSHLPNKEERKALYNRLAKAIVFIKTSNIHSRKVLEYSLDNLIESQYENLSLVRIPILGIAFDINNLGFISGVVFLFLMTLLYLSMVRESRNLKTLFTHGWRDKDIDDRRLYELLSMYQVLTVPLKLYSPDKAKDKWSRKLVFGIFWLPVLILWLVFHYDWHTSSVGASLNPFLTFLTSSSTFLMWLLVLFVAFKIAKRQIRIDRQWDNQYYRLNLEKLLKLKPDDADINFIWTNPDQVRVNWANTVEEIKKIKAQGVEIAERKSVALLEKFIDDCYDLDEEKLGGSKNEQVEAYWKHFQDWFEKSKIKSTRREFRESLIKLMNGSLEGPFDKKQP